MRDFAKYTADKTKLVPRWSYCLYNDVPTVITIRYLIISKVIIVSQTSINIKWVFSQNKALEVASQIPTKKMSAQINIMS